MNNLVSVVMSTYNENDLELKEAIESILNQTYDNLEFIIILDNPSNDNIKKILQKYKSKDSRIRIIYNERNLGLSASLNKGIKEATGDVIARMDADDISISTRIEKQLSYMLDNNLDLLSSNKIDINEKGDILNKNMSLPTKHRNIVRLMEKGNIIYHPTVLIKKSVFKVTGYYREMNSAEDYDLWLRIINRNFKVGVIDEYLLLYRIRDSSISHKDRFRQHLITNYQRNLYKERLKGGEDSFSEVHLSAYLNKKGYYDHAKRNNFNKSYAIFDKAVIDLKNKRVLKAIYNIFNSIRCDITALSFIYSTFRFQFLKMLYRK